MSMIDFWPEKKNSNSFLSVKGSCHFPRVRFLSEQSYVWGELARSQLPLHFEVQFAVRARQEHVPLALRMLLGSFSQKRQHDDMVAAAF
jgi:hypothetical protein